MDAIEAILSRRSISKYTYQQITQQIIDGLLTVAISAPSASNEQPWHFIVIRDREILNEIPILYHYSRMIEEASIAILVCGDLSKLVSRGFWVQDCSAATQNILVAVNAMGLSAVWLGVYPRVDRVNGFRKMFNLPKEVIPFSLISLGYTEVKQSKVDRYKSERIHRNKW